MADKFWKAKERRVLKWFGTNRIGGTGHPGADGIGEDYVIEVFTSPIPKKFLIELEQAEKACQPGKIPVGVFGPKGGQDGEMIIFTKLKYLSSPEEVKKC